MPLLRRSDGDLVRDVPAYRRMLALLLPHRDDAAVFFEQRIDARAALELVRAWNARHEQKITFFHLVLRAIVETLDERPRLNRFTSGGRLYQRRGIWVTYSAKKAMSDDAPVVAIKQRFDPRASFEEMVASVHAAIGEGRSPRASAVDKELSLILKLPLFVLAPLVRLVRRLDAWNLLPRGFIEGDPMFASVFVVNLGSLKMDAIYHHAFDYGTIPIFVTIGQVRDAVAVRPDGSFEARKEVVLRWTYDERIEDGLYCARALDRLREKLESPPRAGGGA